jgi:PAS domain-containing protein
VIPTTRQGSTPIASATDTTQNDKRIRAGQHLTIVGMGASAGGLETLKRFFARMPVDSGLVFVVIQHLSPRYKSSMAEIIAKVTLMPVAQIEDGICIEANHIYLNPPGKNVALFNGRLNLMAPLTAPAVNKPIDYFFRSLAEDQAHKAIGVIMSGTASDGTLGTKAYLQTIIEELETTNEELKSANEELTMVNAELQHKVDELSNASADMDNLLAVSEIAAIFLDNHLDIKRYTPTAANVVKLISTDVGRSLSDLNTNFQAIDLAALARKVLTDLNPIEMEALSLGKSWFTIKITPYRTVDNVFDGVVISFVDIQHIKPEDEQSMRLAALVKNSNDAITVQDFTGKIQSWNQGAERIYGWTE